MRAAPEMAGKVGNYTNFLDDDSFRYCGISGTGTKRSIRVRKISFGEGVERIFPLSTPSVEKIEVLKRHHVRRSKLYFVRELKGKALRLRELRDKPAKAKGSAAEAAS